mgnify:CR=1 FL=1
MNKEELSFIEELEELMETEVSDDSLIDKLIDGDKPPDNQDILAKIKLRNQNK